MIVFIRYHQHMCVSASEFIPELTEAAALGAEKERAKQIMFTVDQLKMKTGAAWLGNFAFILLFLA